MADQTIGLIQTLRGKKNKDLEEIEPNNLPGIIEKKTEEYISKQ